MTAAVAVFFGLFFVQSRGFLGAMAARPSAVDAGSVRLWLSHCLAPLALAAALWLAAWGIGRRWRCGGIEAAALGLGLLAQAVFLLAWAGLLAPLPLALLGVGALVSGFSSWHYPAVRIATMRSLTPWDGAAAGLLAWAAFTALITALAPPTGWDERAYHLALPEIYLKAGGLVDLPWMIHSHWPRLMEVFYSVPLALGSDGIAALLSLGAAVLLVAATARAAGRGAASWAAALTLAGQPALRRIASGAHADAFAALFVFCAAAALARWEEKREDRALALAGLFAGLSASAKMLGLAATGAWGLVLLWRTRRAREALVFGACAAAMVGPWLLWTWKTAGDPVWPFLKLDADSAALAARYLRSNRWDFPPKADFFLHDGPGFLILPALGLLALARAGKPDRVERWLWLAAPAYAVLAWRHNEAWRFLMPVWPALALAAGRGARAAFSAGGARRWAAGALLLAAASPIAVDSPNNALFAVAAPRPSSAPGEDRRRLFENRSVDVAAFYREARGVLPPGAKVLLFRETRGYGAGFDYVWGDPLNQIRIDYRRFTGPDELLARLKALGITHVLDHPSSHLYQEDPGYYDARTIGLMGAAMMRGARTVHARTGIALYELR